MLLGERTATEHEDEGEQGSALHLCRRIYHIAAPVPAG
jgi:hypothetical protein